LKRLLWLGVFFLSASWCFFIPEFTTPDFVAGTCCLVLGILCSIGGISRYVQHQPDVRFTLLLVPLTVVLAFVPFPYNLGIVILMIGLLISLFSSKFIRFQAIPGGLSFAGVLLILQMMIFPFYVSFISHGHRVDILSQVISPLANILGFHTSTNNNLLFVQTLQQTYPVTITWEKLGFFFALNLFIGAIVLFGMILEKKQILKNMIFFLTAGVVYLLLRFIAVLLLYLTTNDLFVFWDPFVTILSFLPFGFLLMKIIPLTDSATVLFQAPSLHLTKKQLAALFLLFLLIFSLASAFLYQDSGSMKPGRILIDEFHSQWEDTTRPMDTEWYGLLSTYNYYSWARWLAYYYPVSTNTNASLSRELLNKYDILILKCPTESYTLPEIQAIKEYVDHGGGLYLIGDHTNVFGMNTYLNQISEEFGIRYNTDATYELGTGDLSVYKAELFFSHPVMRHVPRFDFMTSCTLEPTSLSASLRMENIIIGNRIISEPGTYATENFFRESMASPDSECGYLLQAAAIKSGSGRVVAFTDSTVFSSFCLFTDGYPSFTLGVMNYLNRTNTFTYLNGLFFVFSMIFFISILYLLRHTNKIMILWLFLFSALLAFCIAAPLCSYMTDVSYSPPVALTAYPQICFEQQHSSMNISVKPTASFGENTNNYGTFYVWTQRLGRVPSIVSLHDAIQRGNSIILINPTQPFTETDIQMFTTFIDHGGRLLLMDSIRNSQSTANELLGNFGIWITTSTTNHALFFNESTLINQTWIGNVTSPSLSISGGTPFLLTENATVYASLNEFTNSSTKTIGRIIVVVDSYTFSDAQMGGTFIEPTNEQRQLYETEFFLLNQL
jgi:hypothetical protein